MCWQLLLKNQIKKKNIVKIKLEKTSIKIILNFIFGGNLKKKKFFYFILFPTPFKAHSSAIKAIKFYNFNILLILNLKNIVNMAIRYATYEGHQGTTYIAAKELVSVYLATQIE